MANITGDMLISEAIRQGNSEAIAEVLYGMGMHCLGCAFARGETVKEAAEVHKLDVDELIKKLNEAAEK
jgi:hybrid cluster-associated redox disulfide protein